MFTTTKLQKAIKFAIKTHEVYQKQKRKGKDIAYITHPMTVALLLSQKTSSLDLVISGILHDTIEDCAEEKKVSYKMIKERFGKKVADLVLSVSEKNKDLSWGERKKEALEEMKSFSKDSLLLKSADIVANLSELVDDYNKNKDEAFKSFNASKEDIIIHQLKAIQVIITKWKDNPFNFDLSYLANQLRMMHNFKLASENPAKVLAYKNYNENETISCPLCNWQDKAKNGEHNSDSHHCLEISCPVCDKILLVIEYSSIK